VVVNPSRKPPKKLPVSPVLSPGFSLSYVKPVAGIREMQNLTVNRERLKEEVHFLKYLSFECKIQKASRLG